jgi:hypothetical protein
MEIADQRHVDIHPVELFADIRHGSGRFWPVHGQAHQFGTGAGQFLDLDRGADRIGRIGIGHRLHHDRRIAADHDVLLPV